MDSSSLTDFLHVCEIQSAVMLRTGDPAACHFYQIRRDRMSNQPYEVSVMEGETVYLCRCGKTKTAPFCDGSHGNEGVTPLAHKADKDGTLWVCGCGKSRNNPFCDGSHQG
jgi:CDGSH-type Zn-finger protein